MSFVPQHCRHFLHVRRGGTSVAQAPLDSRARDALQARTVAAKSIVDFALGNPESAPELVDALRAYLDGRPDVLGAATLIALLPGECEPVFADALVAEHGLTFAAEAVAALGKVAVYSRWDKHAEWERTNHSLRVVAADGELSGRWQAECYFERLARRVRGLLAVASEADVLAAERALAGYLDHGTCRFVVPYLLPHRRDWVDGVVAALLDPGFRYGHPGLWALPLRSLESMDQLAPLRHLRWLCDPETLWTLVDQIGPPIAPVVAAVFTAATQARSREPEWLLEHRHDTRGDVLALLVLLDTDEAFELMVSCYDREFQWAVTDAFNAIPTRSLRRLSVIAAGSSKTAATAYHLLVDQKLANPGLVAEVLGADAVARIPQAGQETLPGLLVDPPWTRKRKAAKQVVVPDLAPTVAPWMAWQPGEQQEWASSRRDYWWQHCTDWDSAARRIRAGEHDNHEATSLMVTGPDELARPLLTEWRPRNWAYVGGDELKLLSARYELAGLPLILETIRSYLRSGAPLLGPFLHVDVARTMAYWAATSKSVRPDAVDWFARHGVEAAALLMPDAMGKAGAQRRYAETALRMMDRAAVLAAARGYGQQVESAIEAMLAVSPLDVVPAKVPVPGAWADPLALPQILLAGSESALPDAATVHVLTMLALSVGDEPHPGLEIVEQTCDRASLAGFVLALFHRWSFVGMPAKDGWVLSALGWFGDDEAVRELAPLVKVWPGEGGNARAVKGLDAIGRIGTDAALLELYGISQRIKFKALKARAQEKIDAIAVDLGLTTEQLADRLVPDLGLDSDGGVTLDYGPRRFLVTLDEQLKPQVADSTGKRLKALPKPGAGDDEELAAESHKRFAALKKELRTVAADQIKRLELAMVSQRTWTAAEFRMLLVDHPLVWQLARRVVWIADDTAFRLAEDRTPADIDDNEFTLPADAVVRLAHPLSLGGEVARWAEVFADYEILQPFPQLGRPVHEMAEDGFTRFHGVKVTSGKVLGLRHRGWTLDTDGQYVQSVSRAVSGGGVVVLSIEPVLVLTDPSLFDEHVVDEVKLIGGELDPVTASEVLIDLIGLTGS